MPPKQRKTKPTLRPPVYDPTQHTDPELVVFTELYCACGSLWRQRDLVAYVAPRVREFTARHTGRGHGPASKADWARAREGRREAIYAARGRQAEFRARDYPNVDTADAEVRPWPRFPAPEPPPVVAGRQSPAIPRRITEGA